MGMAIVVPGADYRNNNIGTVTPTEQIALQGIIVTGPASVFVTARFNAMLVPTFTTQRGVSWSITAGSQYASIDSTGTITGVPDVANAPVTIRCTSTADPSIYGEKNILITTSSLVYFDYLTGDGTDFVLMPGLSNIWNATVTVRLVHGGVNTYAFQCFYANDSTQARMAAYVNGSNNVSAYVGTLSTYNIAAKQNIIYRYVWNCGTPGNTDSTFYLYNDTTEALIGSKTSGMRVTMSGKVWIFRYGVGEPGTDIPEGLSPVLTPAGAKFYGMTVVNSDNETLADYRPALYNGVAGVYDTVSQIFRGGYMATGGLSVGNDE